MDGKWRQPGGLPGPGGHGDCDRRGVRRQGGGYSLGRKIAPSFASVGCRVARGPLSRPKPESCRNVALESGSPHSPLWGEDIGNEPFTRVMSEGRGQPRPLAMLGRAPGRREASPGWSSGPCSALRHGLVMEELRNWVSAPRGLKLGAMGCQPPESAAASPPSGPGRAVPTRPLLAALGTSPGEPEPVLGRQEQHRSRAGGRTPVRPGRASGMSAVFAARWENVINALIKGKPLMHKPHQAQAAGLPSTLQANSAGNRAARRLLEANHSPCAKC